MLRESDAKIVLLKKQKKKSVMIRRRYEIY